MNLTGKCREDFERWYNNNRESMCYFDLENEPYEERGFYSMSDSMQYGVYVDYGIQAHKMYMYIKQLPSGWFRLNLDWKGHCISTEYYDCETIEEARIELVNIFNNKANEK